MTTLNEARNAIYKLYKTNQSDFTLGTTLALDGSVDFDEPTTDWARLSVLHSVAFQETLGTSGNRKFERHGNAILQIFTPANEQGHVSRADTYAQNAQAIFEGESIDGTTIYFTDVNVRENGVTDNWYNIVVDASFVYHITK